MRSFSLAALATVVALTTAAGYDDATFISGKFAGPKANTGTVIATLNHGKEPGVDPLTGMQVEGEKGMMTRITLKVSSDFVIPDTPAPSWQIVDSRGNVYLLQQFKVKDGTNREIVLPAYIKDVAKVQVWCSWAETLLGEASFSKVVR